MAYVFGNPHTKSELKARIAAANNGGHPVFVFEPGVGEVPTDGTVYLEGPHYPKAHTWYATGTMKNGRLVAVK